MCGPTTVMTLNPKDSKSSHEKVNSVCQSEFHPFDLFRSILRLISFTLKGLGRISTYRRRNTSSFCVESKWWLDFRLRERNTTVSDPHRKFVTHYVTSIQRVSRQCRIFKRGRRKGTVLPNEFWVFRKSLPLNKDLLSFCDGGGITESIRVLPFDFELYIKEDLREIKILDLLFFCLIYNDFLFNHNKSLSTLTNLGVYICGRVPTCMEVASMDTPVVYVEMNDLSCLSSTVHVSEDSVCSVTSVGLRWRMIDSQKYQG